MEFNNLLHMALVRAWRQSRGNTTPHTVLSRNEVQVVEGIKQAVTRPEQEFYWPVHYV